jgi:hypothetical protein
MRCLRPPDLPNKNIGARGIADAQSKRATTELWRERPLAEVIVALACPTQKRVANLTLSRRRETQANTHVSHSLIQALLDLQLAANDAAVRAPSNAPGVAVSPLHHVHVSGEVRAG